MEIVLREILDADLAPDHRADTEIDRDRVTVMTATQVIDETALKTD